MNTLRKTDKQLSSLISKIGHREEGFSMISAVMALMVGTLLSLAAWATAQSDISFTDKDKWSRLAYQRAQSGVSDYVQHMAEDSGYWKFCDRPDGVTGDGLGQTAINDNDFGVTLHPQRRWLPWATAGSATDLSYNAQYTIDLQPISGSCKPSSSASDRMIDPASGTFRIAVTGRAGPLVPSVLPNGETPESWRQKNWKRATIVTEFRRNGFLDFVYFTDHEGYDPALQPLNRQEQCKAYYQDNLGYDSSQPSSDENRPGRWRQNVYTTNDCSEIQFANGDTVAGPFHTNDGVKIQTAYNTSTSTIFGNANKGDRVEIYNNGRSNCPARTGDLNFSSSSTPSGCQPRVRVNTGVTPVMGPAAKFLDLPQDNDDLVTYATDTGDPTQVGVTYLGKTTIQLNANNTYDVTNQYINGGVKLTGVANPTSGVIYVANDNVAQCQSDPVKLKYAVSIPAGCALLEVQGTYNQSLTLGSQADVVFTGNVLRGSSPTAVLGVIANQYARVRHYRKSTYDMTWAKNGSCSGSSSDVDTATPIVSNQNRTIQAAILTLNNSFIVDGYSCGSQLGTLSVSGAIAQRWRGAVGTGGSGGCSTGTGYCKDYDYDYVFKSQTPPHFLAPSAATWKIIRMRQTLPACSCGING
ncbi:MAG: hypothetical protein JHC98_02535 [Thermoleophilaceae bacterium]|nr:hypothetical protein [Thermoleophilaceae bacterium]